jgi:hypothetical protein
MIFNVFIFQFFARVLVPACEHSKEKKSNKWWFFIKIFYKYNKYFVYLQHPKIKHQVNITQNISFLMIFFQKTIFFLEDELHYKLAQFEKVDENFEGVIRIDK